MSKNSKWLGLRDKLKHFLNCFEKNEFTAIWQSQNNCEHLELFNSK